tara:strand:+ start:20362 stop:21798 length:1437 start_codon:yes stop_codon:yes gene_type:complete
MRWANGVRFSIDYDRKKIGFGDLNIESGESKISYVDPNNDDDIVAGELAEASKYVAGFRNEYTTRSGEEGLTARENGKLVARIADLFKINIKNAVPSDNLKIRNKKGFIFNNHSEFIPNYEDTSDNCHIDGTQIRFITKPKTELDDVGVSININGTEGLLDSSTLTFDSYYIDSSGEAQESGEMSSFGTKALTFETLQSSSVISLNSIKFQPAIQTVEVFKTIVIDSNGIHTHPCYGYDITQNPAAVNTNPYYPENHMNSKNYEGNYRSDPAIVPNTDILTGGEECFYHVINLTRELERIFPQATLGNMNSPDNRIIHETGPEYKLSIKIEQWDTGTELQDSNNVTYYGKEEHVYTMNINLGEWFNTTKDHVGNVIYENSAEIMSTSSDKPYYNLNSYPSNVADKLVFSRNITNTSIYYQRYYHTGDPLTTPTIITQNDYVLRLAFKKKTSTLNEAVDSSYPWKGSFPLLSYSFIQTA